MMTVVMPTPNNRFARGTTIQSGRAGQCPRRSSRPTPTPASSGETRVVFNIKENRYRLVVAISYPYGVCYIRFVGTHAAYDRIDVATV
jgi:mRNA interferase HigB